MITVNNQKIDDKYFPDGTPALMGLPASQEKMNIRWCYEPGEEFRFYAVAKHYRNLTDDLTITIPYLPNARMDRTKNDDECFTLYWFIELISMIGANKVEINDPHSPVAEALLNDYGISYEIIGYPDGCGGYDDLTAVITEILENEDVDGICYPDKGAHSKYTELIDTALPSIWAEKKRNWETGRISELTLVSGDTRIKGETYLIVDDICSYGGTIVRCAEALKNAGASRVIAFVSHCENSMLKGKIPSDANIDAFYTTDDILTDSLPDNDKFHIIRKWRTYDE